MTHTQISRYKIDDETVHHVDLIDFDPETGDVKRRGHGSENRVDYGTMLKDAPDEWEFIGVAEDYADPATVWALYESPDHTEWCAITVTDDLAPPPGMLTAEDRRDISTVFDEASRNMVSFDITGEHVEEALEDVDVDASEIVDELEEGADE